MKSFLSHAKSANADSRRGSVLMITLIFAAAIVLCLGSYLTLSSHSLKLAHRTFLADSAVNLAETGIEEAVWSFNKMGNSSAAADINAAWDPTLWTRTTTIGDAYMTNTGIGYSSAPSVTISGGGGSGATGVAAVTTAYFEGGTTSSTRVTSITITNPGSGYTSVPTISLSGGGGSGATAVARFAATRTMTFNNLEGGATGTVKVWVGGYNGTAVVPTVLAKASVATANGAPVEKIVKVVLSKNAGIQKGVVAFNGINWNGRPLADSYLSSPSAGIPPFRLYHENEARANTTVASLNGPQIDLSHGTVDGNVMTGSGVTVVGRGDISGETIGNFTFPFTMSTPPTAYTYTSLGTLPATITLPRPEVRNAANVVIQAADAPAADGKYYYEAAGVIGNLTVTAGKEIVIKAPTSGSLSMQSGLVLSVSGSNVAKATIFMDGPITLSGNDKINAVAEPNANWAGSLDVYTTTSQPCTLSGNAKFYGSLTAPNSALVGNGGGNDQVDLCGSFVVKSVTSNGHMNFHYDEGLGSAPAARAWGLTLWKEIQTPTERAAIASKLSF